MAKKRRSISGKSQLPSKKRVDKRWQLLTDQFRLRARETAPRTVGERGEHVSMHQMAMKLAEMMMRPDVYGKAVVRQMAAQLGVSAARMLKFQERLIAHAQHVAPEAKSIVSDGRGSKNLTPKRTQALLEEVQKRAKQSLEPAKPCDGGPRGSNLLVTKRRAKRGAAKLANTPANPSRSSSHSAGSKGRRLKRSANGSKDI